MREEFYEIYKDLYDIYRRYPWSPEEWFVLRREPWARLAELRSTRWVTEAVEDAEAELRPTRRLRPDAKHFLLVNFHQMVTLPLIQPDARGVDVPKLQSDLRSDAKTILSTAMDRFPDAPEITASHLLLAISRIWEELRVGRWEVWG